MRRRATFLLAASGLHPRNEQRLSAWTLAALCLAMLASLFWLVSPVYEANAETHDASMYILCAQALLRGEGYAYLGVPFIIRPPGVSVLIAPLIAWRGLDFEALHLMVGAFGIAGALFLFAWGRVRVGIPSAAALAVCLWLNPGYQEFCNQVMSDVPGVALMLAALWIERRRGPRASWKRDVVLGVLIGLSTYVRTIASLTLVAIVVARVIANARAGEARVAWLRFARERLAALALSALFVAVPWSVRNAVVAPPPPADQNFIYSYGTGLFHVDPGDPRSPPRPLAAVFGDVDLRSEQVLRSIGARIEGRGADLPTIWILGPAMILAVLVLLVRRAEASEILFVLVLGVLLVYFGFQGRLVLPLFVIGLAACAELLVELLVRRWNRDVASGLTGLGLLVLTAIDFQPHKDREALARAHAARIAEARAVNAALAPGDRIGARVAWHHALYLGRPVWSLRFEIDRAHRLRSPDLSLERDVTEKGVEVTARAIETIVDRHALDAILVGFEPGGGIITPALRARYGAEEHAGSARLWRTRR